MNNSEQESIGALQTRVHHLEQGLVNLSKDVREGFAQSAKHMSDIAARFEQDKQPRWQAYSVMLTIALALSGFVWWVIADRQNTMAAALMKSDENIAAAISKIGDDKVGRVEFNLTQERGRETRLQINTDAARDRADLQRQIDEVKKAFGETFSLKDAFMQTQRRLDQLEAARRPGG